MKICKKCGVEKQDTDFKNGKNQCKKCVSIYQSKWRKRNKKKCVKYSQKCYKKNIEENRKKQIVNSRKWRKNNPEKYRNSYRHIRLTEERKLEKLNWQRTKSLTVRARRLETMLNMIYLRKAKMTNNRISLLIKKLTKYNEDYNVDVFNKLCSYLNKI